jgi:6-phosphogluconolactonase/glucosamine-6-phosphate isomerase/deaminase
MGDDGHFASIFFKSKQFKKLIDLNKAPDLILTEKLGKPKIKRITFNISMLNISQKIILILNSKKKILLFFKFLKNSKNQYRPINFLINKLKNKLFISIDNKLFKLSDLNKN